MSSFEELSDYDFELVVADLLSALWKVKVDTFPQGRDGGVDLRVLGPCGRPLELGAGEELVVQCKHRPRDGIARLRGELRREASKSVVESATRYVLVTSARLTRVNKGEIVQIFDNRIREEDIFARNDIQDLLRRFPEVERSNAKLWMTSGSMLSVILHQTEHLRSKALIDELLRLRSTYVETPLVREAYDHLERQGICILVGPPGVGKTVTAHILLLRLMHAGWQPVTGIGDVRELESQLVGDVRQVLLYDDFLGQSNLQEKFRPGEDAELVRLVNYVRSETSKCLILTTRDYILRQAAQTYEKLNSPIFDASKVTIRLSSLNIGLRAHILYNQLYYSPLREVAAAAPDKRHRYLALTRHRNYNPRLIQEAIAAAVREGRLESSTGGRRRFRAPEDSVNETEYSNGSPKSNQQVASSSVVLDVPDYLQQALDDPGMLWGHILRYQLSSVQRTLLFVRASFGTPPVFLLDVYAAIRAFCCLENLRIGSLELDAALSVLDGDLLSVSRLERGRAQVLIERLEPGVADAVRKFIEGDSDLMLQLVRSSTAFEQIRWLTTLVSVFREPQARPRQPARAYNRMIINELIAAAERTLMSPRTSIGRDLFGVSRLSPFGDIGQRFRLLKQLYSMSSREPSPTLLDEIGPSLTARIGNIRQAEVYELLSVLREGIPDRWRSKRTDIEVAALEEWGEPDDIDGWNFLRDIIDIVPTTAEYKAEKQGEVEFFIFEELDVIRDRLETDDEDYDVADELQALSDLGDRWDLTIDISELEELAESRREDAAGGEGPVSRDLFSSGEVTNKERTLPNRSDEFRSGTIFDHL